MNTTGQSDITRLRAQIAAEQQAAYLGLHGFAEGSSRHAFIEKRTENIGHCFAQLSEIVGTQHAIEMVAETLQQVRIPPEPPIVGEFQPTSPQADDLPTLPIVSTETGGTSHAFQ